VLDASAETLDLNRQRVRRDDVDYVIADLFDWQPPRTYDAVFFSFWLSHVPRPLFGRFWALVRACLHDGGRVFLVDNRNDPVATAPPRRDPHVVEYADDMHRRRLSDGSEFRVVKVMYEPEELEALLDAEGWDASIDATRWFLFGSAAPA
jgi:demethylmenaquinone methyltransferase/2-methoxy-6-polyprenyl-1,4-benzoquinol methylase